MNPQIPQFFVILVHYGEQKLLTEALVAIHQSTVVPHSVIVVDQAEQPLAGLQQEGLTITRPDVNLGYAAGVAAGLAQLVERASENDVVVVMNNDVLVHPPTFEKLLQYMQQPTDDALVGVCVREGERTVYGGGHVNKLTGRATLHYNSHQPIDYVHGACFAARYKVLRAHSIPQENFLYWEDVQLSWQLSHQGVRLRVANDAYVTHRVNDASALTAQQVYYLVRNGAYFLEHGLSEPWRVWWHGINILRRAYHSLHFTPISPVVARALRDAQRGQRGKISV